MPIPIENVDKVRIEYWRTQAKSVPADVLRELGWLTDDRKVTVNDSAGTRETDGREVHSDVLFLRPRNRETERMWEVVLQIGHRRILTRRLSEGYVARYRGEVSAAKASLDEARAKQEEIESRLDRLARSTSANAERLGSDARRFEAEFRAARKEGRQKDALRAWEKITDRLETLRTLNARVEAVEQVRARVAHEVEDRVRALSSAAAKLREWESSKQPALLPGLFGWIDAFLTREQMNVGSRATEELSRSPFPKVRIARAMNESLDEDLPVLGR